MSSQRPNMPYQGGPKSQNYDRNYNYNASGYGPSSGGGGRGDSSSSFRQPHYVQQHNQQSDGYSRSPQPAWAPNLYLQQRYPDEVGRSQQPMVHTRGNDFAGHTKHFVNPAELHGSPVTLPGYAGNSTVPQWMNPMMHPSSEHMLPQIQQIGSLPVSSFSSSRGSPDSSDYGSGPASNADLSTGDMLSGRESQVSDKEQSELKAALQRQIEYYFSPPNLAKDLFLRNQMDGDHYVPVQLIAGFNCVRRLTQDLHLITDAIRASAKLELDESGNRVRPRSNRSTIVIHDLPDSVTREDLVSLFAKQTVVKPVNYDCADKTCWYVELEDEDEAKEALRYLREDAREFEGKPICARIRALPVTAGPVSPFKTGEGSHPSSGVGTSTVPLVGDESVQQLSRATGDMSLQQAHQFPGYATFPTANAQYFPQMVGPMNPGLMWTPQMQMQAVYDPRLYEYLNQFAAMNQMAYMPPVAQQQQQQQQPPAAPPVYRGGAPVNSRGRGARRGNGNLSYAAGPSNRRGRGDSYPNSGRNSSMSDGRSEQNLTVAHNNPQNQNSRHGSFSSANGALGITSPSGPRSGSSTPPVFVDVRARANSGTGVESDRRNSTVERKPKRPQSEMQGVSDAAVTADLPDTASTVKETQAKFDFEPQMFPPLPGQSSADGAEPASGGPSHSSLSHSTNVSAADVVRGVSNIRANHHGGSAWLDSDYPHPDERNRANTYSDHSTSGHHYNDSSRKKEQASSTDDLPKSGRDHGGAELKLRAAEPIPERPRMNSSAGTQTGPLSGAASSVQNASSSSSSQHAVATVQTSHVAKEDAKPSSPKKLSVGQQNERSPSTLSTSPDNQHSPTSSGSRRNSLGVSKAIEEPEPAGDSISAGKAGGAGEASAKNATFSYARVAQLNRDKLNVAGPGSTSGSAGSGSRVPLTKQSSLDSSSQSADDKRSLADHPASSAGRSSNKPNGNSAARFPRPGSSNSHNSSNGHDQQAQQHVYTNGTTGQHASDGAEMDNDGFTEVTKHKQHHRVERSFRPNGVARHE